MREHLESQDQISDSFPHLTWAGQSEVNIFEESACTHDYPLHHRQIFGWDTRASIPAGVRPSCPDVSPELLDSQRACAQ